MIFHHPERIIAPGIEVQSLYYIFENITWPDEVKIKPNGLIFK
jgi:hypothetical protein